MRTQAIVLSDRGLCQAVRTLRLPERLLLPDSAGTAADFLQARQEWEAAGLAELDFDGTLHPQPRFARMLYNLTHVRSMLRLRREGETVLYVRGPVDLLRLCRKTEAEWQLALRPLAEALGCLRQEWAAGGKWEIATQSPGEEAPLCETLDPDAPEEERRAVVCRHLSRFFPAAPEAIREGGEEYGSLPESGGLPGGPGVSEEGG